jgi:hypothetical protein
MSVVDRADPFGPGLLMIPSGGIGASAVTYTDISASRNLQASDIGTILRNISATDVTITVPAGFTAGWVFATCRRGTGALLVAGSGVTVNDIGGLVAAQVANGSPVGWVFDTATTLNAI